MIVLNCAFNECVTRCTVRYDNDLKLSVNLWQWYAKLYVSKKSKLFDFIFDLHTNLTARYQLHFRDKNTQ